MEKPKNRVIFW